MQQAKHTCHITTVSGVTGARPQKKLYDNSNGKTTARGYGKGTQSKLKGYRARSERQTTELQMKDP